MKLAAAVVEGLPQTDRNMTAVQTEAWKLFEKQVKVRKWGAASLVDTAAVGLWITGPSMLQAVTCPAPTWSAWLLLQSSWALASSSCETVAMGNSPNWLLTLCNLCVPLPAGQKFRRASGSSGRPAGLHLQG